MGGARVSDDRSMLFAVSEQLFHINSVGIEDGALTFRDADYFDTAFLLTDQCGVTANISEALYHHRFAGDTFGQANFFAYRPRRKYTPAVRRKHRGL